MAWDPDIYLSFAGPRFRPVLDLMQRITHEMPGQIVDQFQSFDQLGDLPNIVEVQRAVRIAHVTNSPRKILCRRLAMQRHGVCAALNLDVAHAFVLLKLLH